MHKKTALRHEPRAVFCWFGAGPVKTPCRRTRRLVDGVLQALASLKLGL